MDDFYKKREKFEDSWDSAQAVIVDYGNFCIKLLVTLNSSALLASLAFIGSISKNNMPISEATEISKAIPYALLAWALGLTLVLIAAFCTYICHRWLPHLLSLNHKEEFIDLYKTLSLTEKTAQKYYNAFVLTGITSGVISMSSFLFGIWVLVFSVI